MASTTTCSTSSKQAEHRASLLRCAWPAGRDDGSTGHAEVRTRSEHTTGHDARASCRRVVNDSMRCTLQLAKRSSLSHSADNATEVPVCSCAVSARV